MYFLFVFVLFSLVLPSDLCRDAAAKMNCKQFYLCVCAVCVCVMCVCGTMFTQNVCL